MSCACRGKEPSHVCAFFLRKKARGSRVYCCLEEGTGVTRGLLFGFGVRSELYCCLWDVRG